MMKEAIHLGNLMQQLQNATQSDVEPYEDEYIQSINQRIAFTKEALNNLENELKTKGLYQCFHPAAALETVPVGGEETITVCHECGVEITC